MGRLFWQEDGNTWHFQKDEKDRKGSREECIGQVGLTYRLGSQALSEH